MDISRSVYSLGPAGACCTCEHDWLVLSAGMSAALDPTTECNSATPFGRVPTSSVRPTFTHDTTCAHADGCALRSPPAMSAFIARAESLSPADFRICLQCVEGLRDERNGCPTVLLATRVR